MGLSGIGLSRASCMAYMNIKGVIIPGVSAGSNQVGAIWIWTAQVICPLGARFWAAAVLSRGQSWYQASSPAALLSVPCSKRRRVRGMIGCWGLCLIAYLPWAIKLAHVGMVYHQRPAAPHYARCSRRHRRFGECGSDHALFSQRLDLFGRHPQQLAVHVVVVLAIARRATVKAAPDVGRTFVHLDGYLGHW